MNNIDKILEKVFLLFCLLVLINITVKHIYATSSSSATASVSDHTSPDIYGNAALNDPTNKLVVTLLSPPINLTIASTASSPTIDFSSLISGGTGMIPQLTITANNAGGVVVSIPASTVTSADPSWDGIMDAPSATSVTLPIISGETRTIGTAVALGLPDTALTFNKSVKIVFPNDKNKRIGYIRTSINFTEITRGCNSATDQTIVDAQLVDSAVDCKINSGDNLVVWTKHFTKFATFSSVSTSTSSPDATLAPQSSNTTSNPVCNASKPGGAPRLLPAKPGENMVTLTWEKAADPVTKYLVAYGTTSDAMQYGNPYVGDASTTSTEIRALSSGHTYYFKVKAINDCMPGDFSNIVSSSLISGIVVSPEEEVPAQGYMPASKIVNFLFDITLNLQSTLLNKSSDLVALINFSNFGSVPTGVSLTYKIIDGAGREVFNELGQVTVETELSLSKEFKNLNISSGKYTLLLTTIYGDNVRDEFRQDFEIKAISTSTKNNSRIIWIVLGIIIVGISAFLISLYIKKKGIL